MNTNHIMYKDLPKEVINERKALIPAMGKYRDQGKFAVLRYNKIYVHGIELTSEGIALISEEIVKENPECNSKKRQL